MRLVDRFCGLAAFCFRVFPVAPEAISVGELRVSRFWVCAVAAVEFRVSKRFRGGSMKAGNGPAATPLPIRERK